MTSVDRPQGLTAAISVAAPISGQTLAKVALPRETPKPRALLVRRDLDRWNYFCNLMDGGLAVLGSQLVATVLPVFLRAAGFSDAKIGLVNALGILLVIPLPLVGAWLVRHMRRKKPFVLATGVMQRLYWFTLAALAAFLVPNHPGLFTALYILTLLIKMAVDQVNGPVWTDLVARVTPIDRRGSLFAWRGNLGILPLILLAAVGGVDWALDRYSFPTNYVVVFLVSAVCLSMSLGFVSMIREPISRVRKPAKEDLRERNPLGDLPRILREDRLFRWYLLAQAFISLASSMVAIFLLLTVEDRKFGVDAKSMVGRSLVVTLSCLFVGNIIFARIGDRYGHKCNLITSVLLSVAACLAAILVPNASQYTWVFVLSGLSSAAVGVSSLPMIMEFGGEQHRAKYVAVQNTLLTPLAQVGPLFGGLLRMGTGLTFAFSVAIALSLIGMTILMFCVPNPRKQAHLALAA